MQCILYSTTNVLVTASKKESLSVKKWFRTDRPFKRFQTIMLIHEFGVPVSVDLSTLYLRPFSTCFPEPDVMWCDVMWCGVMWCRTSLRLPSGWPASHLHSAVVARVNATHDSFTAAVLTIAMFFNVRLHIRFLRLILYVRPPTPIYSSAPNGSSALFNDW
jgi:hypothetical protein